MEDATDSLRRTKTTVSEHAGRLSENSVLLTGPYCYPYHLAEGQEARVLVSWCSWHQRPFPANHARTWVKIHLTSVALKTILSLFLTSTGFFSATVWPRRGARLPALALVGSTPDSCVLHLCDVRRAPCTFQSVIQHKLARAIPPEAGLAPVPLNWRLSSVGEAVLLEGLADGPLRWRADDPSCY